MKITREVLRNFMFKEAFTRHYELKITDRKAMLYELNKAIDWYHDEVTE